MRILVFMSDNRILSSNYDTANYNSLAACINYNYCIKNNYEFIYYRPYFNNKDSIVLNNCIDPNTNLTRHCAWAKVLSAKLALEQDYDYTVYIDSDCIFKDFNITIESLITQYTNNIIFLNDNPSNPDKPNSGFFICKNCLESLNFINDWYNVNIPDKNIIHSWDQAGLWAIFKNYNISIINDWMLVEKKGQFLRHICHAENKIRIPYFKNFINTHDIKYDDNIFKVKCIDYNTSNGADEKLFISDNIFIWNKNKIKFLENNIICSQDTSKKGKYIILSKNILQVFFENNEYSFLFNDNYSEFKSVKRSDNSIMIGEIFNSAILENKKYIWQSSNIIFLENNLMDAFGKGSYSFIGKYKIQANFGRRQHVITFNDNYTEFTSVRVDDKQIVIGSLVRE